MGRVLDKFNFQDKDSSYSMPGSEHWQTRARKLKSRKWRELNRKIMNDQHAAF